MDRRNFLKSTAGLGTLLALPELLKAAETSDQPNIFMIFSDDATVWDFGCYGNKTVRTPRIDQLAREGLVFDNMFTPTPMCGPSRMAMMTGLYPFRNGAHPNWSEVKPDTKSIAHYMASLGYRVILLGKKHIKPPESFPFEHYDDDLGLLGPGPDLKRILADPGDKPLCVIMCKFHAHFGWFHNNHHYDPTKVDMPPYLVDTVETRKLRANYYSYIEDMDIAVGRVLDLLKHSGMEENTLFLWTCDHGTYWPHERQNVYDAALKVPCIARWPGKIKSGTRTDALINYVDMVPTFIDLAGGDQQTVVSKCGSQPLDGKSFLPILSGQARDHHSQVYGCVTWGVMEAYPMRTVRTKTHRYIWNIDSHFKYPSMWALDKPGNEMMNEVWRSWEQKAKTDVFAAERVNAELYRPEEELYDLRSDPYELNNIADDPAQQEVLVSLRNKLKQWMMQQGDNGDSAYHADNPDKPFLNEIYSRQFVVNANLTALGANGGMNDLALVKLECPIWQTKIYYTLDGSEPTKHSSLYNKPFELEPPVVIKVKGSRSRKLNFFKKNQK